MYFKLYLLQYPWTASIGNFTGTMEKVTNYKHQCGGSIITTKFILTAGHCFKDTSVLNKIENIAILLGTANLNVRRHNEHLFMFVAEIVIHPKYDPGKSNLGIILILYADILN